MERMSPVRAPLRRPYSRCRCRYLMSSGAWHILRYVCCNSLQSRSMTHLQVNYASASQPDYSAIQSTSYAFSMPDTAMMQQRDHYEHRPSLRHDIPAEPSTQYARETWWEVVLNLYSPTYEYTMGYTAPLPPGVRQSATQRVNDDLRVLFRYSSYWLSFLNIPRLLRRLRDSEGRKTLQPSFVLGALALATFLQSSNSENSKGAPGRERALRLKDEAQSALEASLASRWIDDNLVQAAWVRKHSCLHSRRIRLRGFHTSSVAACILRNLRASIARV